MDRVNHYYPFGLEFGGDLNLNGTVSPNYKYSSQGQEKQTETGWSSYRWRNYDAAMGRFFNVDPLSENYAYQSHYNFSENRVVDGRELEGLEWQSTKREQDLPSDPVEFAEMIAGGINSLRAAVANNVVRTANVVTRDATRNKYVVDEDGGLTMLTGVPKESFKEKVANGALDWGTIALSIGGGPEGMLTVQGGKVPTLRAFESVKEFQRLEMRAAKLSQKPRPNLPFTKAGKKAVIDLNAHKYGGKTKCAKCKVETVPAKQSKKGVVPDKKETQVDHIEAESLGGSGTPNNGQALCRDCNIKKSNKRE
ncbi:HNH endonuclease [Chryseobacterium sp.]|uniref:HNH endonuclease n=1 Tax=Chryseobacterium sp. TaxID=1871047 RepID=UPI0031DD9385